MAANGQHLGLVWIERSNNFFVVRNRRDWMLIDLFDDVAFLQFRHTAVWVDIGDDHSANSVWQIEFSRQFRRQLPDVNRCQRAASLLFIRWRGLLGRRLLRQYPPCLIIDRLFLDLGGQFHWLAAAQHIEFHFFIQFHLRHEAAQFGETFHVVLIKPADKISFLQLCLFSWRTRYHCVNDHSFLRVGLAGPRHARLDAEIAANDAAIFQQTLQRRANGVGRYCKTDSLRAAAARNDRGVNANDFTAQIDEWPAAVAGMDARIRRQQIAKHIAAIRSTL